MDICRSAWTSPRGTLAEVFVLLEEDPSIWDMRGGRRCALPPILVPTLDARNWAQNTGPGDQIDWGNASRFGQRHWNLMHVAVESMAPIGSMVPGAVRYDTRQCDDQCLTRILEIPSWSYAIAHKIIARQLIQ